MSAQPHSAKSTIGLIGLGNLGHPIALNLLSAGYPLHVHSLDAREAEDLLARGASWANGVADAAAQSDVLITVLPGPSQLRAVMIGEGGALAQMRPGSTFLDMSTSSVELALEIKALAEARGVTAMEAPVSFLAKAPIGASRASASLQLFVGGTREAFDAQLPLLRAIGGMPDQSYHAGPTGSGNAIKILLNQRWFVYAAGTAEMIAVGSRLGLDLRVLQRALCASPSQSNFLQYDINSVFEAGDYDEGFTLDLVCKDLQLGLGLAARAGIDPEMTRLVEELHQRALQKYGPASGEMSVVKLYEDAAGAQFRCPPNPGT